MLRKLFKRKKGKLAMFSDGSVHSIRETGPSRGRLHRIDPYSSPTKLDDVSVSGSLKSTDCLDERPDYSHEDDMHELETAMQEIYIGHGDSPHEGRIFIEQDVEQEKEGEVLGGGREEQRRDNTQMVDGEKINTQDREAQQVMGDDGDLEDQVSPNIAGCGRRAVADRCDEKKEMEGDSNDIIDSHRQRSGGIEDGDEDHPKHALVYLMETERDAIETMSVVSDGRTDDAFSTVLELSELSKVIGALEAESGTPFNASKSLKDGCSNLTDDGKDDDADPRPSGTVPISFPVVGSQGSNKGLPGDVACSPPSNGSFSAGASLGGVTTSTAQDQASRSMVKLYNDLALRLMDEQQDYDQALVMLRKAESHLDNDSAWDSIHSAQDDKDFDDKVPLEGQAMKRIRLRAVTYNNLGCLYKRRGQPEEALGYLSKAMELEDLTGSVQECASTHLNMCASYSVLHQYANALAHAERAIVLLQRELWGGMASSFQRGTAFLAQTMDEIIKLINTRDGKVLQESSNVSMSALSRESAISILAPSSDALRRHQQLVSLITVLAMAYHNAAVEHERLGNIREATVSYHRSCSLGMRFLGSKASMTIALNRAQREFVIRQKGEYRVISGSEDGSVRRGSSHEMKAKGTNRRSSSMSGKEAGSRLTSAKSAPSLSSKPPSHRKTTSSAGSSSKIKRSIAADRKHLQRRR